MKNILCIIFIALLLGGCTKITDVIDREPPNNLVPENVAKNAEGVRNLLNGAYAKLHDQYYYMVLTEVIPGALSGTIARNGSLVNLQYVDNAVLPTLAEVNNCWVAMYKMINQANWVIQLVNELPEGEMAQAERETITAQARALRAMAHFDALRFFGQFYDVNSPWGVVIRTEPADFTTRNIARSTVAEVYNQVLSDLDYAIEKAPDFSTPVFISKTAAQAIKARVLLFRGDYGEAAAMADDVISGGKRKLSATYAKVFSDGFSSTEMIFMRATDAITFTGDRKRFTYGNRHAIASPWFKTFMAGDPRIPATYTASNSAIVKTNNAAHFAPSYFFRLAEMYLIKAEGLARSGAPIADAKAPLDSIITRAYGTPQTSPATTREALLNDIYAQIIKELAFENGSEWFAGIRFDSIMSVKPTVVDVDQYILPIPEAETMSNPFFGDQNPGY
ncbi:RagB/SusD family nutrient uptake outer membrane protein [Chitinophaga sp. XS-30]|uniref:RagB/SusD family nutrient uptake outer membrane protein n=1 Tax=Chitinophaga sp. XS-30 TaxID=2604421 RepID=UPI0011DD6646|nr:RagB/SusD family nutrient uptake outer membrane protein [Chitinophaga sp. XS-30]QEH43853.1 RagB/SusD family nutrient uptake outer membrane protein [Chitinophaga sp. XS-30]